MKYNTALVIVLSVFFLGLFLFGTAGIISSNQLAIEKEKTHQMELQAM